MITGTSEWSPEDPDMKESISNERFGQAILEAHGYTERKQEISIGGYIVLAIMVAVIAFLLSGCSLAYAENLTASYYSKASLIKEGTWKNGVEKRMSNGGQFSDFGLTAASRDYPLGTKVKVTRLDTGASVVVVVTDRCNKRFAHKRIDLSYEAMHRLNGIRKGLVPVNIVEVL